MHDTAAARLNHLVTLREFVDNCFSDGTCGTDNQNFHNYSPIFLMCGNLIESPRGTRKLPGIVPNRIAPAANRGYELKLCPFTCYSNTVDSSGVRQASVPTARRSPCLTAISKVRKTALIGPSLQDFTDR